MEFVNEKLNEFNEFLQEKKIAIIGIDYCNVKLIQYLYNIQADDVVVFDKREIEHINGDMMDKVITYGMEYSLGENCFNKLEGFDIIFRSLDYLPTIKEIENEEQRGAIITTWLEMFMKVCPSTIIGITGSSGKLTTAALIYETLKNDGFNCYIGGDDETFLFSKLDEMTDEDFVILKLTNRQLMGMKTSPNIAVITNMNLDELDIDYSEEEYKEAVKNIFKYQNRNDLLVIDYDNKILRDFSAEAKAEVRYFSRDNKLLKGYIVADNKIKLCEGQFRVHILDSKNLVLRGDHNLINATCSIIATSRFVDLEVCINTIKEFKDLQNRLEFIYETENRVKWYNDSASIVPSRTVTALEAFPIRNILLIAGGDYNEKFKYNIMAMPIINSCKYLILMGDTADIIEQTVKYNLRRTGYDVEIVRVKDLEHAIEFANKKSQKGDVVLFSPGSKDKEHYENFEERGNEFKNLVVEKIIPQE